MIKHIKVENLNGKLNYDLNFHSDLNIFTGRNGSGKTTLLKMLWYLAQSNIEGLLKEIFFESIILQTGEEYLSLENLKNGNVKLNFKTNYKDLTNSYISDSVIHRDNYFLTINQDTLFFPTFRRIEGGFGIIQEGIISLIVQKSLYNRFSKTEKKITHKFISSISTKDIAHLLTQKYTEISDKILKIEKEQSDFISQSIAESKGKEQEALQEIKKKQEETNLKKEALLKPFTVLSELISDIFSDKSVKITETLTLGEASQAIISDKLSAGEKQMLSFLCYCIFTENSIIFIDEPELSLHPDWQRTFIPTIMELSKNNQFFIATHSPFIYSKYPDKEIVLDPDKGGE